MALASAFRYKCVPPIDEWSKLVSVFIPLDQDTWLFIHMSWPMGAVPVLARETKSHVLYMIGMNEHKKKGLSPLSIHAADVQQKKTHHPTSSWVHPVTGALLLSVTDLRVLAYLFPLYIVLLYHTQEIFTRACHRNKLFLSSQECNMKSIPLRF